jgi:pyruvate dehydrogenase E2 component (dihydrolipoamide acetyltransferase)
MIEFRLPSLGSDMDDGRLVEWRVRPGDAVKKGDILAVVDTSKAAVDIEAWVEGTVHRLLTAVGQKIPVGQVMALLLAPGEAAPAEAAGAPAAAVAAGPTGETYAAPKPAPTVPVVAPAPVASRRRVTPAARRRAAERGIAIDQLAATGPDGAVTLADVERAASAPPTAPADRAAEMRKAIAAAMARSKREIPHYQLAETVPLRAALDALRTFNAQRPVTQRVLPAALLLKAVALAAREVPEVNGLYVDGRFRPAAAVHLGVAISLRGGGLVAPALHDVAAKPIGLLMSELADLVRRARAGSLRSSEMSDPTLTVTNLGDTGIDAVYGVIYPPQVALVGLGRIVERPWVEAGQLVVMPTVTATLAADHRVSDGHRGARFLVLLRERLQQPQDLLADLPGDPHERV